LISSHPALAGALAPWGDSLPKRTWRPVEDLYHLRASHAYPVAGCQGEPLPEREPCRKPKPGDRELPLGLSDCGACACEETP
jgi:hypothetical protein